ncbi:hypothetical protein P5673_006544 [Acropora cervicornis]|uniref:Uncharacterized protein n=1 Tax=Acropora cervicornis TaxID=6130 RepID=A0AAD9QWC6_ACRCE|nr:hypothetical protein P5673_006544 [Acropora cervicornis]
MDGAHKPTEVSSYRTQVLDNGRPFFLLPCNNQLYVKHGSHADSPSYLETSKRKGTFFKGSFEDGLGDNESEEIPPESVLPPSEPSVASTALSSTSVVSTTSPAFLAVVANAVQQVLSAQQAASLPAWSVPTSMANSASVDAPSANLSGNHSSLLAAQVSPFATSGAGFASSVPATATPSASGRPNNCVVPTFVSTFSSPIPSFAQSALPSTLNVAFPSRTIGPASFVSLSVLHQPFVVGPGFSPVPAKLVSQIVAGKFVELHELLPSNIVSSEPEPQLLFDRRPVLTSPSKKPKRRIDDIATWLGAFSIFCLILVSHFPHCWKDLLQYQLLILRTYRQFSGRVWLSCDRAFRENAAATNLTDWSQLNSTLFSLHSAG